MRRASRCTAAVLLAAALLVPAGTRAYEDDEEDERHRNLREQVEAMHDMDTAETDEEYQAAKRRFDEVTGRERERKREEIFDFIDRGGSPSIPPAPPAPQSRSPR